MLVAVVGHARWRLVVGAIVVALALVGAPRVASAAPRPTSTPTPAANGLPAVRSPGDPSNTTSATSATTDHTTSPIGFLAVIGGAVLVVAGTLALFVVATRRRRGRVLSLIDATPAENDGDPDIDLCEVRRPERPFIESDARR